MHSVRHEQLSEDEYLAQEERAQVRHEFVDGFVYAMPGASIRHNKITINLAFALRQVSRCRLTAMDVKLKARRAYYYPDLMLSCAAQADAAIESEPCLIAEVLSPTTETIDRGAKLRAYREIASLQAYVLVSQEQRLVEIYRRAGELWTYESIDDGRAIQWPCADGPVTLDEVYAGVEFDSLPLRAPVVEYDAG